MTRIKDATYWAEQIRAGKITAEALLEQTNEKIAQLNPALNAVVAQDLKMALTDLSVTENGFFAGVPFALKMLGQTHAGLPNTASARLFAGSIAQTDDNYVKALMRAGLTPFGQTNSPEFGFKNITDSKLYGDTKNAWNQEYYSGGSSGGAASAVASGMFPMAGASDGGGSIRIPASFSGLIGLKMTRGRMPQGPGSYRGWQGASISGALAVSVRDVANFVAEMQTIQEASPYQAKLLDKKLLTNLSVPQKRLKIAYSLEAPIQGLKISETSRLATEKAVDFLKSQGHELIEVSFPLDARSLIRSYYRMNAAETFAMLEPLEKLKGRKINSEELELLSYALLETGRKAPVSSYINALDEWDLASSVFEEKIFRQYDLFLTPTTAKTAPKIGEPLMSNSVLEEMRQISTQDFEKQVEIIEQAFERSLEFTPYNFISNLTGQPALSLPVFVEQNTNLPQGIQLWGAKNSEVILLQVALAFEQADQFILPEFYRQ